MLLRTIWPANSTVGLRSCNQESPKPLPIGMKPDVATWVRSGSGSGVTDGSCSGSGSNSALNWAVVSWPMCAEPGPDVRRRACGVSVSGGGGEPVAAVSPAVAEQHAVGFAAGRDLVRGHSGGTARQPGTHRIEQVLQVARLARGVDRGGGRIDRPRDVHGEPVEQPAESHLGDPAPVQRLVGPPDAEDQTDSSHRCTVAPEPQSMACTRSMVSAWSAVLSGR